MIFTLKSTAVGRFFGVLTIDKARRVEYNYKDMIKIYATG